MSQVYMLLIFAGVDDLVSAFALGVSFDHLSGLAAEEGEDGGRALAQLKQSLVARAVLEGRRKLLKLVAFDGLLRVGAELLERLRVLLAQTYEVIVVRARLGR